MTSSLTRNPASLLIIASLLALGLLATASGCAALAAEPEVVQAEEPNIVQTEPPQGQLCERAAPMLVAVERPFIGTDDHVAQFTALAEVAPEHLLAPIGLLATHYQDHVSPANPDSQDFVNFPPEIQDAAVLLDSELRAACD